MVEKLKRRNAKNAQNSNLGMITQTEKDYNEIVINTAKRG